MAEDFKIEVPINMQGGGVGDGVGGGNQAIKELKKLNDNTLKLNKTMILNIDIIEILSSLVSDLFKVMQPLFKILSLLFMVIFLPLLPLMKGLIEGFAEIIKVIRAFQSGELSLWGFIVEFVTKGLWGLAKAFIDFGASIGKWLYDALIVPIFNFGVMVGNAGVNAIRWIWQQWKDIFSALGDLTLKIWELIKGLFQGVIEVHSKVWNFIKGFFKGTINVATTVWNWFKGLFTGAIKGIGGFLGFAEGGIVPGPIGAPQLAIVHGGETITPYGMSNLTVNINNPVIRQDSDIKKMANEFSRVLQRRISGRVTNG